MKSPAIGILPNSCQIAAAAAQCKLAQTQLCTWSRVLGLTYFYWFDQKPAGHAILVYELQSGKIEVYDINEGSYALSVPHSCHDIRAIAKALHYRDPHIHICHWVD